MVTPQVIIRVLIRITHVRHDWVFVFRQFQIIPVRRRFGRAAVLDIILVSPVGTLRFVVEVRPEGAGQVFADGDEFK